MKRTDKHISRQRGRRLPRRKGALLSSELLLVVPVVAALLFGIVEISCLVSTFNNLKHASCIGARVGSVTPGQCHDSVTATVQQVLDNPELIEEVKIVYDDSGEPGEICRVTLQLPMSEAAPDLLGVLGVKLTGTMEASTAMRKE
jgi:hypothetical protein